MSLQILGVTYQNNLSSSTKPVVTQFFSVLIYARPFYLKITIGLGFCGKSEKIKKPRVNSEVR